MSSFRCQGRSLIRYFGVEKQGTIRISTTRGAHLTADVIIDALAERERRINLDSSISPEVAEQKALELEYGLDSAAHRRHVIRVARKRSKTLSALQKNRADRRRRARSQVSGFVRSPNLGMMRGRRER